MSGTKFTPGPWVFHGNNGAITDQTPAQNEIAEIHLNGWEKLGMGASNGNLIAAAPDGYSLGEMVMEICGNPKGVSPARQELLYETALKFTKKARGE